MRLDFKVLLVDDDYEDSIKRRGIDKLATAISEKIRNKGFIPNVIIKGNVVSIEKEHKTRRTDLFISDNNLGGHNPTETDSGIDLYFSLKNDFICDFILYTSSDKSEIVNKLTVRLKETQDPNIFSRFTFVTRENGSDWYDSIYQVIDHILSKREEINNLRGLYAQLVSKIHIKLEGLIKESNDFDEVIKKAFNKKKINEELKDSLHYHRAIRNGLLHNDEELCSTRHEYRIKFYFSGRDRYIYETDFQKERVSLRDLYNKVDELL